MRHIKLFEAFNKKLENFRLNLVKPGMKPGKYLFSCIDGSWNSFFGVFDIEGLKKLEDSMNTVCVCAEISDAIKGITKNKNPALEEHTEIVINEVPNDVKYMTILYRQLDGFGNVLSDDRKISQVSNKEPEMIINTAGKLSSENIVHGGSLIASSDKIKNDDVIESLDIVLNELFYIYHNGGEVESSKNYLDLFDESIGYNLVGEVSIEQIEPYIPEIIDAGAPKEFLKRLEEIKNTPVEKPKRITISSQEEIDLDKEFSKLSRELVDTKMETDRLRRGVIEPYGTARVENIDPAKIKASKELEKRYLKEMGELIKKYKGKVPDDYLEMLEQSLKNAIDYSNR
jgi:hypothetical protein